MTRTWAESAAALDATVAVIATVEGWGTSAGQFRVCSQVPDYAVGDALYREWLADWPRLLGEQVDPNGGFATAGELEIQIVDIGDAITAEWRIDAQPSTFVDGDISASVTTVNVDNGAACTTGLVFVGNEAMTVSSIAANALTVVRGTLGTDATKHKDGDPAYIRQPYIRSRRLTLKVVNLDAASASEEREYGTFFIDNFELDDELSIYVVRGKSQQKWFSRLCVRRKSWSGVAISTPRSGAGGFAESLEFQDASPAFQYVPQWPSARGFIRNQRTGEILTCSPVTSALNPSLYLGARGTTGTRIDSIEAGDGFRSVYSADPSLFDAATAPSFFRFSPGPTPSSARNSGTWTPSANWIDIILNLAVSAADPNDGIDSGAPTDSMTGTLANRVAAYGAWDCLPYGVGLGTPATLIDFVAALSVRTRTAEFVFPNFFVGEEPIEFGELVETHFLRPIGAFFSTVSGQARIVLPRSPVANASTVAIGPSNMLWRKVGKRSYANRVKVSRDLNQFASAIVYEIKNQSGEDDTIVINNADYKGTYGQSGYYALEDATIKIPVPSARVDRDGTVAFLKQIGQSKIFRFSKPPWRIEIPTDVSTYAVGVGDLVSVTHEQIPDLELGVRGIVSKKGTVFERTPSLTPEEGLTHDLTVILTQGRYGRIPPCARIVSVVDTGGPIREITVTANRYTHSDALDSLPTTDAAAFAVGDVIRMRSRNGVYYSSVATPIVAISGNVISVSGTFGGLLTAGVGTAGLLLSYQDSSGAAVQQTDNYVFWADAVNRTIGATALPPWQYGDR